MLRSQTEIFLKCSCRSGSRRRQGQRRPSWCVSRSQTHLEGFSATQLQERQPEAPAEGPPPGGAVAEAPQSVLQHRLGQNLTICLFASQLQERQLEAPVEGPPPDGAKGSGGWWGGNEGLRHAESKIAALKAENKKLSDLASRRGQVTVTSEKAHIRLRGLPVVTLSRKAW